MEKFMIIYGRIALILIGIAEIPVTLYFLYELYLMIVPAIKCRKVKDCLDDECIYRTACTHIKHTEWEMLPPWKRPPKPQQKKPSTVHRLYLRFKDFLF